MKNEVKALMLNFAKELEARKIATKEDFEYVCNQLGLKAKKNESSKKDSLSAVS